MKDFINTVNGWPLILKLILCIPMLEIFYGVCRIINAIARGDVLWIVLAILTVFPGAFFMWVLDLVWVLLKGHAFMLGDEILG